ncbi:MAG: hypothetical protein MJ174_10725 [Treponema sp.]|nr:hypothetical protein [Treponema sp.]
MNNLPQRCTCWSYIHFVLEDLYFLAGIAGIIIIVITVINYCKQQKESLIKESDKTHELSMQFSNLIKKWKELQDKLKENLKNTNCNLSQTDKYQDILKSKKENSRQFFINEKEFSDANISLDEINSFIDEFDNFSRKYILNSNKDDFIDKDKFLEIYSNIFSFSENLKHENADKLFNQFSKKVTKEIDKIIPKE